MNTNAPVSPAPARWARAMSAVGAVALAACSHAASDTSADLASSGDGAADYGDDTSYPGAGSSDGGGSGSFGGPAPDLGSDDAGDPPSVGKFARCPVTPPEPWIYCQDFELEGSVVGEFFDYQDGDGSFVPTHDGAASGITAMRATYHGGEPGAGWLSVAFGRNPIVYGRQPAVAGESDFQAIYWRLRVRTEQGWPDVGPGALAEVTSFAAKDWGQAMVARLRSHPDEGTTLFGEAVTCVEGDTVACSGLDDPSGLRELTPLEGDFPLFSAAESGIWHCVEGHVALNTPGVTDGVFEFWVDEQLQGSRTDVDWRGGWSDYALNLFTLRNFWPGGAPKDLIRDIDDLVLSTERVGCE